MVQRSRDAGANSRSSFLDNEFWANEIVADIADSHRLRFQDNECYGNASGMTIVDSASGTLFNNLWTGNGVEDGLSGIFVSENASAMIENNTFDENQWQEAILFDSDAKGEVRDTIVTNTMGTGLSCTLFDPSTVLFENNDTAFNGVDVSACLVDPATHLWDDPLYAPGPAGLLVARRLSLPANGEPDGRQRIGIGVDHLLVVPLLHDRPFRRPRRHRHRRSWLPLLLFVAKGSSGVPMK